MSKAIVVLRFAFCAVALASASTHAGADPAKPSPTPAPTMSKQPMYRTVHPFTETELHRLSTSKASELQGLHDKVRTECQGGSGGARCQQATQVLKERGPGLQGEIGELQKHLDTARQTKLPVKVPVLTPDRPGTGSPCGPKGCVVMSTHPHASTVDDPVASFADGGGSSGSTGGPGGSSNVKQCFIATAAYGSAQAREVEVLRRFRDERLAGTRLGDLFVSAYYTISPPIAAYIAPRESLRGVVRAGLSPIVYTVEHPGTSFWIGVAAVAASLAARRRLRRRAA